MNTLTDYPKPSPKYGHADLSKSPWRPLGGWHVQDGGGYARVYSRTRRATTARRATVRKIAGLWRWEIAEFSLLTRAVRRICARCSRGSLFAAAAFGFADLAARTAD